MSSPSHGHTGVADDSSMGSQMVPPKNKLRFLHIERLANNELFNTWSHAQHGADEAKFLTWEKDSSGRKQVDPLRFEFPWREQIWMDEGRQVRYPPGSLRRRLSSLISQGSAHL